MISEENFNRPYFKDPFGNTNLAVDGSERPIPFKLDIPDGFQYHITDLKYRVFLDMEQHLDIRHEFKSDLFFEKKLTNGFWFGFYLKNNKFYGEEIINMDDFAWKIGQVESTFNFDKSNTTERHFYFQSCIRSQILSRNGRNLIIEVRDDFTYFNEIEIEAMGDLVKIK